MTPRATIRYSDDELLAAVRAVALAVGANAPERLSQPRFDRERATVIDEYPGLPTARAIYMRLNSGTSGRISWESIVRGALAGGASAQQTIVAGRRSTPMVPVDRRVVFFALTLVARELGVRTLGPDRYDATASALRRTRRGALASLLPTANQLISYAGDWDMALELADLEPRAREQPSANAQVTAPTNAPIRSASVPVDRVTLDRCVDALGSYWDTLPAGREPKQKTYGAWAVGKQNCPAPSRFAQHGGFRAMRELARKRRRASPQPRSAP